MKKLKNNQGITLIALVITIIVLLILAGVTSADAYIESKLQAGIDTTQGKVKLEGETLKLTGKEEGATAQIIGSYSAENGLTINIIHDH